MCNFPSLSWSSKKKRKESSRRDWEEREPMELIWPGVQMATTTVKMSSSFLFARPCAKVTVDFLISSSQTTLWGGSCMSASTDERPGSPRSLSNLLQVTQLISHQAVGLEPRYLWLRTRALQMTYSAIGFEVNVNESTVMWNKVSLNRKIH